MGATVPLTEEGDDEDGEEVDALHEYEGVELSIVALAHTVIDPGAVVIESVDADAAQVAVAAARRADDLAVGAQTGRLQLLEELFEVELGVFLDGARIGEPDRDPEEHG